jgi:hypothetical protein
MFVTDSGKALLISDVDNPVMDIQLPVWLKDAPQETKMEYFHLVRKHLRAYLSRDVRGGYPCKLCGAYVSGTYDHECVPNEHKPQEVPMEIVWDLQPIPALDRIATALERLVELLEKDNGQAF